MMTNKKNPFTRPSFIGAAALTAFIVILGLVLAVRQLVAGGGADPDPTNPSPATTAPSTPSALSADSICGLSGLVESGTVASAPETNWEYEDTTAYPTSETYGPGEMSPEGVRYCFQHSPEGALFAAANSVSQGSGAHSEDWIKYFLSANAPNRDQLINDAGESSGSSSIRMNIMGYRVLSYDANSARIDIAIRGAGSGRAVYGSIIHNLTWESGDWKLLPKDSEDPLPMVQIPDLAGYISWGN